MLPVLYGRATWFLTLREKHRMFENRVLRRIFGPKREEITGEWRWTYNEQLCGLYSSPNIIRVIKSRRMRWVGHMACVGNRRGAYRVLVRIRVLHRRISIGRPRLKWEDDIEVYVQEVELEGMDWVVLARIRTDNEVLHYARQVIWTRISLSEYSASSSWSSE